MAQVFKSACPLNCWDSCGFEVTVENGKIIKVEGDPDHPITKGKICGRGRMLETRTNSGDRLLYPLKKVGEEFVRISWEQALDEIAEKLRDIKSLYGTQAVLHSHDYANGGLLKNLDKRFFNCYGGVTELIGSICWGAGIEAQKWDFGNAWSHAPEDIFNSKHIVIWGRNVARTNMHLFQYLQDAKKQGIKITVIDPIYNATAKIATSYLSIKPGNDGILAAGIMKEILRLGLEDRDFIENHTAGFEDLKEMLQEITMEEVERLTEVNRSDITELAYIYSNKPVMTYLGLGMQRYTNGGNTIRLIDALAAISGNIGIPGGGANFGNLQVGQSFTTEALSLPERKKAGRQFTMMEQAKGILEASDPPVKMIVVTCGNPLTQVPNTNQVKEAFTSVDTLVVIDQYMTDTAELADYVLPSATVFEEEDIYYSSMYHHYVNYGPALVQAPGEVKSDLWIWTELARRLGFGEEFEFTREELIDRGLSKVKDFGITYEALKNNKHMPLPVSPVPWDDKAFQTASGKFEFTSSLGESKGFDGKLKLSLPEELSDSVQAKKYPYTLITMHPLRSNHSQHYPIIEGLQSVKVEISKDIAEQKGLQEKDVVRVFNDRGEIQGTVKILPISHRSTINIDEGQWAKFGGSVNALTSERVSDNGLGSTLYDCLVDIAKV